MIFELIFELKFFDLRVFSGGTFIAEILTCVYMAQNIYTISAPSFTYASPTPKKRFYLYRFSPFIP